MYFEDKIRYNIDQHIGLRKDAPVVVAVSGGADSVALLAALAASGYECVAAHCNFHLRGAESDRDMRFTQELCAHLDVDLYIKDFDVDERCEATGESVEMACRELRYAWFDSLIDRLRAQAVAVAHHREDNIETFFLNLMRGSSISGLTGMRWRNNMVIRPMLDLSRAEIEDYLAARQLQFVNDSTNAENIYSRNRLRNVVIPAITSQFPGAQAGILTSMGILTENNEFYRQAIAEKTEIYLTGNVIHLAELIAEQPSARLLLYEMTRQWGFNMKQIDDIIASAQKTGLSFSAGNTTLELDRGKLNIVGRTALSADETEVSLHRDIISPLKIAVSDLPVATFRPSRDPGTAYFDISILDGDPKFALRKWRRGDRITPFGMKGSRLLSDIFSDAKYSAADKRATWLLTRNGVIVWAVGLRATNLYSITPDTRRYLRLTLDPKSRAR